MLLIAEMGTISWIPYWLEFAIEVFKSIIISKIL